VESAALGSCSGGLWAGIADNFAHLKGGRYRWRVFNRSTIQPDFHGAASKNILSFIY
jgi:hypothetical protein